jgi:dolichol-phosphate mannosyltransferase
MSLNLFLLMTEVKTDRWRSFKKLSIDDPRVKYISFSRNFGHQPALKAGLDHAQFAGVVSLDADLQHPVELIPE